MSGNKEDLDKLFEYLKSILFDSEIQTLDIQTLGEEYQKLGSGLAFLQTAVEELHAYAGALSQGNLSVQHPARDNFLCSNLKNIHANLNHLTWQAKQVAAGDYTQHVSYLGEFSESFNEMICQLKERRDILKAESEQIQKHVQMIEDYNEFLKKLSQRRREWILVVDAESKKIVYCNKYDEPEHLNPNVCMNCRNRLCIYDDIINWQDGEHKQEWEAGNIEQGIYRVMTFPTEWHGRSAYAHSVEDITLSKKITEKLTSKAYLDAGTGIYNRMFFREYMERILKEKTEVILCYMDMDGLKYVNDNYGHKEGDVYIENYVSLIKKSFRNTDVFARIGGDEFCLILRDVDIELVERKIIEARQQFIDNNQKEYPVSFSFGTFHLDRSARSMTLDEIMSIADEKMYHFKRLNKKERPS